MREVLQSLLGLPSQALFDETLRHSRNLAAAQWEAAACLLAIEQSRAYSDAGFSSVYQYAEVRLGIASHTAAEMVRVARVLVSFPLLSAAIRDGSVNWTKAREITRVVTAESETTWVKFARSHTTRDVERRVVKSPRQWKKEQRSRQDRREGNPGGHPNDGSEDPRRGSHPHREDRTAPGGPAGRRPAPGDGATGDGTQGSGASTTWRDNGSRVEEQDLFGDSGPGASRGPADSGRPSPPAGNEAADGGREPTGHPGSDPAEREEQATSASPGRDDMSEQPKPAPASSGRDDVSAQPTPAPASPDRAGESEQPTPAPASPHRAGEREQPMPGASSPAGHEDRAAEGEAAEGQPAPRPKVDSDDEDSDPEVPPDLQRVGLRFLLTGVQLRMFEMATGVLKTRNRSLRRREDMLEEMCRLVLASVGSSASSRVRSTLVVYRDPATGADWVETDRGPLRVSREDVETIAAEGEIVQVARPASEASLPDEILERSRAPRIPRRDVREFLGSPPIAPTKPCEAPAAREQPLASPHTSADHREVSPACEQPTEARDRAISPDEVAQPAGAAPEPPSEQQSPAMSPSPGCTSSTHPPGGSSRRAGPGGRRVPVPAAVLRQLWLRSGGRCENPGCGRGGPLHVHHDDAYSDDPHNDPDRMRLLCERCHGHFHEEDFATRLEWANARAWAMSRARPNPTSTRDG